MNDTCIVRNATDHAIQVELVSDFKMQTPVNHTVSIDSGATETVPGRRMRFIMGETHYLLHSPNGDEINLTQPSSLHENRLRTIESFPCRAKEIQGITEEINRLENLIKNTKDKTTKEEYARQLLEQRNALTNIIGDRADVWEQLGLGGIAVISGAATPAAVVAGIQGIGFTTGGIAAGSWAAGMMSSLGGASTASGGLVATLQSIGAVGALSGAASVGVAALSGLAVYKLGGRLLERYKNQNNTGCWTVCHAAR